MQKKTVVLSDVEFLILGALATEAALKTEGQVPPQTTRALQNLAHKVLDVASAVRGGELEFGIGVLEPGEQPPVEVATRGSRPSIILGEPGTEKLVD
jgi:hypothetical protein